MTVLACDFGGRRIKLGVVNAGRLIANAVLPAHSDQPLSQRLPEVSRAFHELCAARGLDLNACNGIGVAYPSVINPHDSRIVDEFGKYGDVRTMDLSAWARTEFGLPLALENDARMALIGEWQYGAGKGRDNVAIITLGTGIGTAAVIEGRLLVGPHGQAGILGGHLTVAQQGRSCVCGNQGCAEAEASTSVLSAIASQLPGFVESALAQGSSLTYEDVFREQQKGDAAASQLAERSLRVWGTLAVNLIHAYDPELLILSGGVMGSRAIILPAIVEWVRKHAHTPWGQVVITASQLGDSAPLLAAEWLVARRFAEGARR